jgi:hypothetical protein
MPELDVFDHWKIFLIETNVCARLIYRFDATQRRSLGVDGSVP